MTVFPLLLVSSLSGQRDALHAFDPLAQKTKEEKTTRIYSTAAVNDSSEGGERRGWKRLFAFAWVGTNQRAYTQKGRA